jgi:hypothetical protein
MNMLTIPTNIHKEQIAILGNMRGTTNALPFTIDGQEYPSHTLLFMGFAGAHEGEGLFAGDLRFEPRPKDITEKLDAIDFRRLLELGRRIMDHEESAIQQEVINGD